MTDQFEERRKDHVLNEARRDAHAAKIRMGDALRELEQAEREWVAACRHVDAVEGHQPVGFREMRGILK